VKLPAKPTVKDLLEIIKELDKRVKELELTAFHAIWAKQNETFLKYRNKEEKK